MGRYIGPKNKIARRFGVNLGLKTNPTKVARRLSQPPGAHGTTKKRKTVSGYGRQLQEKQKAKFMYGIRERQLHRYVREATRLTGDSSVYLQQLLERRLDNVVHRLGFAVTRAQARQMVTHGMFMVNGKSLNIPSYLVRVGDTIALKPNKAQRPSFSHVTEQLAAKEMPSWLTVDAEKKSGRVTSLPLDKDFEKVFDVKLIIEYFSSR